MNAILDLLDEAPPRRAASPGVTTVLELQSLDEGLMVSGYLAGLKNKCDFAQTDLSYQHGYLNGLVDGKHATASPAQSLLAREYVQSGALRLDVSRWRAAH